jgi:hypothetical protein
MAHPFRERPEARSGPLSSSYPELHAVMPAQAGMTIFRNPHGSGRLSRTCRRSRQAGMRGGNDGGYEAQPYATSGFTSPLHTAQTPSGAEHLPVPHFLYLPQEILPLLVWVVLQFDPIPFYTLDPQKPF